VHDRRRMHGGNVRRHTRGLRYWPCLQSVYGRMRIDTCAGRQSTSGFAVGGLGRLLYARILRILSDSPANAIVCCLLAPTSHARASYR
jgi:hypothetical protein